MKSVGGQWILFVVASITSLVLWALLHGTVYCTAVTVRLCWVYNVGPHSVFADNCTLDDLLSCHSFFTLLRPVHTGHWQQFVADFGNKLFPETATNCCQCGQAFNQWRLTSACCTYHTVASVPEFLRRQVYAGGHVCMWGRPWTWQQCPDDRGADIDDHWTGKGPVTA